MAHFTESKLKSSNVQIIERATIQKKMQQSDYGISGHYDE